LARLHHRVEFFVTGLGRTELSDLRPLTALQTLDLSRTEVRDVTPLAALATLRTLDLRRINPTGVEKLLQTGLTIIRDDAAPRASR
jgi:Leucine-rich repeat (LRR) protein